MDVPLNITQIRITGFQIPQIKLSDHTPLVCEFEPALLQKTLGKN